MIDNPKYTIITPQYNSFSLMGRYFESLEHQSFKDFEVIVIDDCSTDGSYEKLVDYASSSSLNITIKRTSQNSGPGEARNIGIDNASGEWITFVDNDDWVKESFLEEINTVIERESVNCIIFDYYTYNEGKIGLAKSMYLGEEGMKSLSDCVISVRNHTVGKFYKLSECKDIKFPKLKRCEDVAYVCQAIVACGSAYYYNKPLYYYLQRSTSLSNNKVLDESDMIRAFGILEETIGVDFQNELKEKSVCDILYGVLLMMCKAGKSRKEIKEYLSSYENKYPKWWQCKIIRSLGKSKQIFLLFARLHFIYGLKVLSGVHSRIIR